MKKVSSWHSYKEYIEDGNEKTLVYSGLFGLDDEYEYVKHFDVKQVYPFYNVLGQIDNNSKFAFGYNLDSDKVKSLFKETNFINKINKIKLLSSDDAYVDTNCKIEQNSLNSNDIFTLKAENFNLIIGDFSSDFLFEGMKGNKKSFSLADDRVVTVVNEKNIEFRKSAYKKIRFYYEIIDLNALLDMCKDIKTNIKKQNVAEGYIIINLLAFIKMIMNSDVIISYDDNEVVLSKKTKLSNGKYCLDNLIDNLNAFRQEIKLSDEQLKNQFLSIFTDNKNANSLADVVIKVLNETLQKNKISEKEAILNQPSIKEMLKLFIEKFFDYFKSSRANLQYKLPSPQF